MAALGFDVLLDAGLSGESVEVLIGPDVLVVADYGAGQVLGPLDDVLHRAALGDMPTMLARADRDGIAMSAIAGAVSVGDSGAFLTIEMYDMVGSAAAVLLSPPNTRGGSALVRMTPPRAKARMRRALELVAPEQLPGLLAGAWWDFLSRHVLWEICRADVSGNRTVLAGNRPDVAPSALMNSALAAIERESGTGRRQSNGMAVAAPLPVDPVDLEAGKLPRRRSGGGEPIRIHPASRRWRWQPVVPYPDEAVITTSPFDNANLSKREMEVLDLYADGYASAEIAEELGIERSTVLSHRSNAEKKIRAALDIPARSAAS